MEPWLWTPVGLPSLSTTFAGGTHAVVETCTRCFIADPTPLLVHPPNEGVWVSCSSGPVWIGLLTLVQVFYFFFFFGCTHVLISLTQIPKSGICKGTYYRRFGGLTKTPPNQFPKWSDLFHSQQQGEFQKRLHGLDHIWCLSFTFDHSDQCEMTSHSHPRLKVLSIFSSACRPFAHLQSWVFCLLPPF